MRRSRPLLGTFVEITVHGLSSTVARAAIDRAFAAVEHVQTRMNRFDPASDIGRLNAAGVGQATKVHASTWRVLALAESFRRHSDGAFNVARSNAPRRPSFALLAGHRVRRQASAPVDLGGIAKGFAVDRAVAALRRAGATAGAVNAGGDLRVFGPLSVPVHVRHPGHPDVLLPLTTLRDGAVATSANYFDAPGAARLRPVDNRPLWLGHGSVSVQARTAVVADALTKVVAVRGLAGAAPLLRRHRAAALVLMDDGRVFTTEEVRHAA